MFDHLTRSQGNPWSLLHVRQSELGVNRGSYQSSRTSIFQPSALTSRTIWVRVLADIPITRKPTEVRMGRGKGNPTGWIARVSRGQILFEMDGVSLPNARQAATLAAHKLCSSTKFVQWS
ncbi:hypothetical protein MTR67_048725 [Solanum verrucosum]|uniref:Large ribosomal subunit protein uL16m n=1 Tax=Solanum verrucosum TaxID=315347 RepID=A0AAF0ZZX6_SOLVR|nr:hypothetical protein MTR67_048725 [Solanum verrucosum]